jgi:hypothetical protein
MFATLQPFLLPGRVSIEQAVMPTGSNCLAGSFASVVPIGLFRELSRCCNAMGVLSN